MIKGIICDFGGVLGTDADTIFRDVLIENRISEEEFKEVWRLHWPNMKIGKTDTKPIWAELKKRYPNLNLNQMKIDYENKISVDKKMLGFFKILKSKGFKLAILANEANDWMDIKIEKGRLKEIFNIIHSSADLKIPKPEKEAYLKTVKDLGLETNEVIFIDNMERNKKAAEECEIKSILFESLAKLKKDLAELDIK
jgi:HAD superfamily hydrolase (TIGR01509 family)